ncbi:NAD(P)/FAD-dependent oxidoreductase [Limnohabitans sp. Rim8]|jgi:NADH dehydrogenase|uniref:NAD(P)/FAD-dependent oxidoreductase n=1 Tax=Limnohabitans sp. Rim8 TaxID=1100718 RepID=UPI0025E807F6|nr:NAD(P)/FAD-dependent oxidoreductase [Limnohabitans sp. Rim8]
MSKQHKIVIVGGGAGGLELATRLGHAYGRNKRAVVTLVDKNRTHIWKPKLHEIASGSMDLGDHEVDYMAQAHWHHFTFRIGELAGLDRSHKTIELAPYLDEDGVAVTPTQRISYDTLVICIGSLSNDFGTQGVKAYALKLETQHDAKSFHSKMVNACIRAHHQSEVIHKRQLHVAIIGAGATGVELAAELHRTTREVVAFGLDRIDVDKDIKVSLIEAADRILPALQPRMSQATEKLLSHLGVQVLTSSKVMEVTPTGIRLADGREIESELVVWAAGVKAPDFLKDFSGLETNRINQLVVFDTLQTTRDPDVFALGDCAACPCSDADGGRAGFVPPRAQAAHQQATHMFQQIKRRMAHQPLKAYRYRDFGSLVSLGKFTTVGNMMGGLTGKSLMIEGYFAKLMYLSLYKLHELAIHGLIKTTLFTLSRMITKQTNPTVKLH